MWIFNDDRASGAALCERRHLVEKGPAHGLAGVTSGRRFSRNFSARRPKTLKLTGLFGVIASLLFIASSLFATVGQYQVREIRPDVFAWVSEDVLSQAGDPQFNRAGNAGFIITNEGVVVIDATNSPFNARDLLFEIRQRTSLPVRYVIDTSGAPDLTLGNEVFEDFKPAILSTPQAQAAVELYRRNLPERLDNDWRLDRSMRGIHPTVPTKTFGDKTALPGLGRQIQLISLGSNASPGDAAVFLPQSKVVFLGDVFQNGYIPRIGHGDVRHWIETLRQVEQWDAEVYVPAHGEPGSKSDVAAFRRFLEWLIDSVQTRIHEGKPLAEIEKELLPFAKYAWHAPELEQQAIEAVYAQLAPSKSAPSPAAGKR
jgi:cyclase